MADNHGGFWKPWKDGAIENSIKACGVIMVFLFVSGLLGAGYDPVMSNPYVWGLYIRQIAINLTSR